MFYNTGSKQRDATIFILDQNYKKMASVEGKVPAGKITPFNITLQHFFYKSCIFNTLKDCCKQLSFHTFENIK
jgi:hypothetical protein